MSDDNMKDKNQTVFKDEVVDSTSQSTGTAGSSTGLEQNVAGLLCYLGGFITGIIFLVIEKKNNTVRFHAMQSLTISVVLFVLSIVLSFIPFIGWILGLLLAPVSLVLWIVLMLKAYQGSMFKLPMIGDFAEKQVNQMDNN